MTPAKLIADEEREPVRLDLFLAARLGPDHTRSQLARMIKAGLVTVNGRPARPASQVRAGDRVEVAEPPRAAVTTPPRPAPEIEVLYADRDLIVVNKPAGMTVHPAPGHPDATLVDALLARFPELAAMREGDGVFRPGIVHRLDRETSGVMVVARTNQAKASLSQQFKARKVSKVYLAIVRGTLRRDWMTIARPLGRHPTDRKRMSVVSRRPREAVSRVTVVARFGAAAGQGAEQSATLVAVCPETGRTHQIRVHLAAAGHPCLGDGLYGGGSRKTRAGMGAAFRRHALHALALSFAHPRTGERLRFCALPPGDFIGFLAARGFKLDAAKVGGLAAADWTTD
jgi:23S rRNA pseudouridine1911/1915/1917 synthase